MAELKKADFKIKVTDQMRRDTDGLRDQLKNDPAVQMLFEKNSLPLSLLDTKPWTIESWRKEYAPCLGCQSLNRCRQKMRGYYPDLKYDGILQNIYTPCRYRREEQSSLKHLDHYRINDLPSDLFTVSFKSIDLEKESDAYLNTFNVLMDACARQEGIYLYGPMGTGKTYLSACGANEAARQGKSVSFVHYPSFVSRLAMAIHDGEYKKELQRAMYCDFLVLDDIGAENVTEWNRDSILLPLLNHRYESGLTTWFTSNCDFDTLLVHFSFARNKEDQMKAERIMERITHMAKAQALSGEDRRKNVQNDFH